MRMSREAVFSTARWLVVGIPLADLTLVLSGVLDTRTGLLVGIGLELVLSIVLVAEAIAFRRAYRLGRAVGRTRSEAAGLGFRAAWPPLVITLATAEIGLFRSLWWAVRRRRAVSQGDIALPYSDRFTVMLGAVCCLGVLELGVVHVLAARWPAVQWVLFGIGVYAVLWFLGFGLALRQHPHLLRGEELVLRFGHFRAVHIPIEHLVAVRTGATSGHRRNIVLGDGELALPVMGDTNLELRFEPPVEVEVKCGRHALSRISCYVDAPRQAAGLLRADASRRTAEAVAGP
jgi:hypothetical protein